MLPKIQKALHNMRLMFSMATVTNESTLENPQPAETWVTLPSNERMQWTPLSYEIVDIHIMSLSTGLRFCLKASSSGQENQLCASADPPEGLVMVKQRLWHNERFPRITAWQYILDDGSGWFLDVDVCHHPCPPHFLSFLDHSRKHEQPR